MKLNKKWIVLVFLFFCYSIILPVITARAETVTETISDELDDKTDELLDGMDFEELQKYIDSIAELGGVSVKEVLKEILNGDYTIEYNQLGDGIVLLFKDNFGSLVSAFALIVAITLLCGVFNSLKSNILHGNTSDIIELYGQLSVGLVVLTCFVSAFDAVFSAISSMQKQMQLFSPLLLALMAAGGATSSVAIYKPAVAFMSSAVLELFLSIVLPTSIAIVIFSWIGCLNKNVKTEKLSEFFRAFNKWIIGLTLGIFTLFISIQGISAAQHDGISLSMIKYVLSGSIPVVGGFLSSSAELIMAGSILIKNALGSFSIIVLVATVFRPIVLLISMQLFLKISAATTEPIGGSIPVLLSKLSNDLNIFLAAICCIAFLYFLSILLFLCSTGVAFS